MKAHRVADPVRAAKPLLLPSSESDGASRPIHTVTQFSDKYPAFTQPSLRNLIFCSEDRVNSRGECIPGNGLAEAGAIVRIGRRVLIDETAFFRWVSAKAKIPAVRTMERNFHRDFDLRRTLNLMVDTANMAEDARERKDHEAFRRAVEIMTEQVRTIRAHLAEAADA